MKRHLDPTPFLAHVDQLPSRQVAQTIGVTPAAVRNWRQGRRQMRSRIAEHAAIALGLHPENLWPGEWQ